MRWNHLLSRGCAHAGETGSRNQGSSGKQPDRHPVQLGGQDPITAGGGRDRHVVAPADQFRALIQRHACRAPVGPVGAEERHDLQDAHQIVGDGWSRRPNDRVGWNVAGNQRGRADDRVRADGDAAQHGASGAQPRAVFDDDRAVVELEGRRPAIVASRAEVHALRNGIRRIR